MFWIIFQTWDLGWWNLHRNTENSNAFQLFPYQATVKEKLPTAEPTSQTRKEKTPPVVEPPEEAVQVEVRRVEKSMETQNGRMMIWGVS